MKLYILINNWDFSSGIAGQNCHVYDSLDKAKKAFKEKIIEARTDMEDVDPEEWYSKDRTAWVIRSKNDDYKEDNIVIRLYERELNE